MQENRGIIIDTNVLSNKEFCNLLKEGIVENLSFQTFIWFSNSSREQYIV